MRNVQRNIAIFFIFFHFCDFITPEVEIGGQFRQRYQNSTMVLYNLDRYGFSVLDGGLSLVRIQQKAKGVFFGRKLVYNLGFKIKGLTFVTPPHFEPCVPKTFFF